jgi:hypothetical protein
MSQAEGYAAKIIQEAEALIGKVQKDLDGAGDFYREMGINPDKVAPALEQFMGPKQKEELAAILRADDEVVQREVDEAAARASFGSAPAGSSAAKKPRNMI